MSALLDLDPRIGSTTPRICTPPLPQHADPDAEWGIKPEATWGPLCCEFLEGLLGWHLLPWQKWLYYRALEKRGDGTGFRFRILLILVGRQQGKTTWGRGLGLWRLFMDPRGRPDPCWPAAKLAVVAAQNLEYAEATLKEIVDEIRDSPLLAPELINHAVTNGKHRAILTYRRLWRAATASRKGGRSLPVDFAWLDEIREHTTNDAWRAIEPTTTVRPCSQLLATSNAGDARSIVLRSLRETAMRNVTTGHTLETRTGFFEWSVPEDVDPRDPSYWHLAQPALGLLNDFCLEDLLGKFEAMEAGDMPGFQTEYLALDVATPILTTAGWKTMDSVKPGDKVFHPDGHPVEVTHVTAVFGDSNCYEVETTDGRKVICDADHRWTVQDRRRCGGKAVPFWETVNTAELLRRGVTRNPAGGGKFAYRLPDQKAIISKPVDLPIDPYLIGLWLGDGSATKPEICTGKQDLSELLAQLPATVTGVRRGGNNGYYVTFRTSHHRAQDGTGFPAQCRQLGIWRKEDKHIPDLYLTAGTEQRLALLQGLCDSDGSIDPAGRVRFCSTRKRLAEQVLYLARSLGWRATVNDGPAYMVTWTHDAAEPPPFRYRRKLARINPRPSRAGERTTISIRSITPVAPRAVRCITVASRDSLFLAGRGLTPTANCQWVDSLQPGIIPAQAWMDTLDKESKRAENSPVYVCIDLNYHRTRGYVGIAARRADGDTHIEVLPTPPRGTEWIAGWLAERKGRFAGVCIQKSGAPASSLTPELRTAGCDIVDWGNPVTQLSDGAAAFYDGIVAGTIHHRPAQVLDRAAASTIATNSKDAWFFSRRNSPVDAAPLVACCGAVWLLNNPPPVTGEPQVWDWPDDDTIEAWRKEADERFS